MISFQVDMHRPAGRALPARPSRHDVLLRRSGYLPGSANAAWAGDADSPNPVRKVARIFAVIARDGRKRPSESCYKMFRSAPGPAQRSLHAEERREMMTTSCRDLVTWLKHLPGILVEIEQNTKGGNMDQEIEQFLREARRYLGL